MDRKLVTQSKDFKTMKYPQRYFILKKLLLFCCQISRWSSYYAGRVLITLELTELIIIIIIIMNK